jgi:hypothetical protein
MNDEYLWQKTGSDPEIARLEDVLKAYRYREDAPPVIAAAKTAVSIPRWRFAFAFAATGLATAGLVIGMWLRYSADDWKTDITFVHQPSSESSKTETAPALDPATPRPDQKPAAITRIPGATYASAGRRAAQKTRPVKTAVVTLTEEERYAYDRLMYALAVSSSKMKIARDAINGVDQGENAHPTNR